MKNIVKMTQSSPVYLVRLSQAKQEYAVNIKEAAISLSNTLSMLSEDSQDSVFAQKKAVSSDEAQIGTRIVSDDYSRLPEDPLIRVNRLATTQVNVGNEYYMTEKDFLPEHIVFRYLSVMTAMISSIIYARMLRTERSSRGCVTLSIKHGSV